MKETPILATKRLVLRPLALSDAARIQLLFPHWEIVQHLAAVVPWPYPQDGALTYLRDVALPGMERGSEWYWVLCLRNAPGALIGVISLADNEHDNRGFWLGLRWQRRGLMSEAVATVNDVWFDDLKRPALRVQKAAANEASRRISLSTGMRMVCTGEKDFVCGHLPMERWEQSAKEWQTHRGVRP